MQQISRQKATLGATQFSVFNTAGGFTNAVRVTAVRKLLRDPGLVAIRHSKMTDDYALDAELMFGAGTDDTEFLRQELATENYEGGSWRFQWRETMVRCYLHHFMVIDILPLDQGRERIEAALNGARAKACREILPSPHLDRRIGELARALDQMQLNHSGTPTS